VFLKVQNHSVGEGNFTHHVATLYALASTKWERCTEGEPKRQKKHELHGWSRVNDELKPRVRIEMRIEMKD
jgi:hypothetical protein